MLGSYLLDDKPVKRLDGHLCCIRGVSLCLLEYPVSQAVSCVKFSHIGAGWFWEHGGVQLDCGSSSFLAQVVVAQHEAEDAVS